MLPADQAAKLSAKAKAHEAQVVKIQALARGHISRVKHGCVGKKKVAGKGGRRKASDKGMSDLEQKMLSARSGQFRGGMPSNRRADSQRNGPVYAKQLAEMPDYSNEATRATEK